MLTVLLAAALLLPLLVAGLIVFSFAPLNSSTAGGSGDSAGLALRRTATVFAPLAVLPAAALSVLAEPTASWKLDWMLFGTVLAVDPVARSLVLVASLLFGAGLMAVTWVKLRGERGAEPRTTALSAFMLVCFTGTIGTFLAADVVTFYLAFAVMSFSAVGLVFHYRTESARRATRIYLVMSVLSETAILAGLILTSAAGGYLLADAPAAIAGSDHTGLIVALLLIGCGVKAGTVPLHIWLPLAHPAAPPAASAVLSGAMVKAGLVGWLRLFGGSEAHALVTAGWVLLAVALLGSFAAALIGVLQDDPKVVLAYSTISQMGFITVLVAVGMINPGLSEATLAAAVLYAVHHGLAKGVLFLGVPVMEHRGGGIWGALVLIGMAGAGLAVAGAPLTSGAYGKYVSKEAVEDVSALGPGLGHLLSLDQVLPLVATGSTLLMMRFAFVMFSKEVHPRRPDAELFSWLGVCAAGVSLPWLIGQWWIPQAGEFSWEASALWDASWPIVLGLLLGAAVWWAAYTKKLPSWVRADGALVPPGDVVVPEEALIRRASCATVSLLEGAHRFTSMTREQTAVSTGSAAAWFRANTQRAETAISGWQGSGVVILLLLSTAVVVMAVNWW